MARHLNLSRMPATGDFSAFAHLNAEKSALYRALLGVFVTERARFTIALRPPEIAAGLAHATLPTPLSSASADAAIPIPSETELAAALEQLVAWKNLSATRDTADVASVEEFYRSRYLYQLSAEGEAAEHAIGTFFQHLHRPGELQATTLRDLLKLLDQLSAELAAPEPDRDRLHLAFQALIDRFEELTSRAQSFMRSLQSTVELHGIELDAFLAYKDALIDHLDRFLGELVTSTARIAAALHELARFDLDAAFHLLAERDLADALQPAAADFSAAAARWRARWDGLRRWFDHPGGTSQAELLRSRARSAIPALLTAISQLNERRHQRADRAADFLALARWFAEAPSDADAHRLWRAAFALTPARHLRVDDATLVARENAGETARTSWLAGTPLRIAPRLRQTGFYTARGGPRTVIDRAEEKALLAALTREEAAQISRARARLARGEPLRLAALGELDRAEFDLFLDLLGEALARKENASAAVEAFSSDGQLRIRLEPVASAPPATLRTAHGAFTGPDHIVTISPARPPAVRGEPPFADSASPSGPPVAFLA
jgi:uncharacterized protein (TIGR02677 family)